MKVSYKVKYTYPIWAYDKRRVSTLTYHDRVLALRAESKRTAFEFRFEDLFTNEEWLNMSIADRQKAEKAFRHEVAKMDDVRMPFSSAHDAQVKLYNVVYAYNGIKRNFKQVENEGF